MRCFLIDSDVLYGCDTFQLTKKAIYDNKSEDTRIGEGFDFKKF